MNNVRLHLNTSQLLPGLIFGTAAVVLAYEPVLWLVQTWQDPAYDSKGFLIFLVCAGLFLWSVTSPRNSTRPGSTRWAVILLTATALIRLVGQVFAVNIIGALALVIDVYALATLAGVQHRERPISPGWLAVCFLFVLPLERVLQHSIGFGLQSLSAGSACLILGGLFDNVSCHGVRILINQKDVLVDLPCSGARTLLLLQLFYAACMTVYRPNLTSGLFGFCVTLFSSLWINILRIMVLAVGIAYPEMVLGMDVMAEPGHSLLGLAALALGCLPILLWARSHGREPKIQQSVISTPRFDGRTYYLPRLSGLYSINLKFIQWQWLLDSWSSREDHCQPSQNTDRRRPVWHQGFPTHEDRQP